MQRGLSHEPHAERFVEFEVIDAEQFQALLQLREETVLEFDALGGDLVMGADALQVIAQEDERHQQDEAQRDKRRRRFRYEGNRGRDEDEEEGQHLADAVDHRGVADVQIFLDLRLLGGRESGEIGIAEAALDGDGLDGFSAHRTGLGIGFHAGSSLAKVYSVRRAVANGVHRAHGGWGGARGHTYGVLGGRLGVPLGRGLGGRVRS